MIQYCLHRKNTFSFFQNRQRWSTGAMSLVIATKKNRIKIHVIFCFTVFDNKFLKGNA